MFDSNEHAQQEAALIRHGARAQLLKAARNVDPNAGRGGGDITMVGGALAAATGPSGTMANIETRTPGANQISVHVVREGETLSEIASLYDVTTDTVAWANDMGSDRTIQPGQELIILPVSGVRHTVEGGDTLSTIAEQYDGTVQEIKSYNNLGDDASLAVGDEIVIPNGEMHQPSTQPTQTQVARSSGGNTRTSGTSNVSGGYYTRPVVGGVRTQGLHGYNAVDIGAGRGTTVRASAAGTVIISKNYGWNGGYGKYVVIKHGNGTQTLYAHNRANLVSSGQYVEQGAAIARMGSTGRSTGPHVHFEIRGGPRNPF
jgi:murein DD-endopeptidase MepM/ murein hydrolase activator NlpD